MEYPTIEQVEVADHRQICLWHRFLPSPGEIAIGRYNFEEVMESECIVLNRIEERLNEFGGFTPAISKSIGWGR